MTKKRNDRAQEKRRYYIAYGSNLDVQQMLQRCPGAEIIGTSKIPDYRLLFKGSKTGSYLTIEKAEGYEVPVGIWSVTKDAENRLDFYEGYPSFYYKEEMRLPVTLWQSMIIRNLDCFAYIMHEDRHLGIPSDRYMDTCTRGYLDFGFDPEYLTEARYYSVHVAEDTKEGA